MVTIKDIAKRAGVSRGTVDRVLNNRSGVNPETEARVRALIEEMGYRPNMAGQMLAVKKRRLHLASALMVTPRMLLLDEPTVGADLHSCRLILSMLEHLRDMGCAIALISHQAGELEQVCSRILTLEGGRLVREEGPPWGE